MIAACARRLLKLILGGMKRIRENKRVGVACNSPGGVEVKEKCWKLKWPESIPSSATSSFRLVLDRVKRIR